jgi:hypothetical protein
MSDSNDFTACPRCGTNLEVAVECPVCNAAFDAAAENAATPPPLPAPNHEFGAMFCTTCESIAKPRRVVPGSIGATACLVVVALIGLAFSSLIAAMFFVAACVYSALRDMASHQACAHCGSRDIIPVDSPRARRGIGNAA